LCRKKNAHKGDFGHVLVVAGSAAYSGAAALCSEAALRSGAGLVTLAIPKGINSGIIKIKPKEVITLPLPETKEATLSPRALKVLCGHGRKYSVVAIGPGLSRNKSTQAFIRRLIILCKKPLIIDADGLNALSSRLKLLKKAAVNNKGIVLTPHPGEMSRLTGKAITDIEKNRQKYAAEFAKKYAVALVLKGHETVVADHKGRLYVNKTGNAGMAKGGSGDVLTGIIAAFIAQGLDTFNAAKYAVYLHGLAGDLAAEEKTQISLIASDIIAKIPKAIKACS